MNYLVPWPIPPPPPPPPPPPRTAHKRQLSGASSHSAVGAFDLHPAGPDTLSEHVTAAGRDGTNEATCSHQACSSCKELRLIVLGLEQKMVMEVARVQQEAHREHEQLLTEVNKKWKELETTSWKHVGELKEQNRALQARSHELEVQNGHLGRHVMLLQDQLATFKDQQSQYQSVLRATQDRAALLSATLADSKMVKVPHTGADIW